MASQTQSQKSSLLLILLLLLLLGLAILLLPSVNLQVNTSTQNGSEGQCQSAGQSFDEQQEVFTLAQAAEQYRSTNPFRGNYGLGSYTFCYKDGTQKRMQSPLFKGYRNDTNPNQPSNATHSEQSTYGWLQMQFSRLPTDQRAVTAIYAVIFSQVIVCILCQKDMVSWQRVLRQKAKTNALYLSIWEIAPGRGFAPATYPSGNGTPITLDDLEKVPIELAS